MSFFTKLSSFGQSIYRIVFVVVAIFLFVIFIYNLDLLIEHIKNNPILGLPYFLIQLIHHILVKYTFIVIGLVALLFLLGRISPKSRLLAIFYFALPFPFLSIAFGIVEFLPFNFIVSGILFLFGIGIWKNKTWVHIVALVLNAVLLGGAAFFFNLFINTHCEGLGCIGIAIISLLSLYVVGFTLLTSPFLWYSIRTRRDTGVSKKTVLEAVVVEIIIAVLVGVAFGPSYLAYIGKVTENRSIHQPRWDQERLERKQAVQKAVESGRILYPSYLPMGWERESESIGKIQYVKYGIERQVFQVKQSSISSIEAKSKEDLWTDDDRWDERANTSINDMPARYVTWHTAACSISDEIRELWWHDGDIFRSLYCSCPCTLSKNELIRVAESMK